MYSHCSWYLLLPGPHFPEWQLYFHLKFAKKSRGNQFITICRYLKKTKNFHLEKWVEIRTKIVTFKISIVVKT